jgi:hypothetical protein
MHPSNGRSIVPCLLAILTLLAPRLVIVVLLLLTHWFQGVFHGQVSPWIPLLLGFVFLPTTLLWYVAVQHWYGGHWTIVPLVGLFFALLIDISPASGRRRARVV